MFKRKTKLRIHDIEPQEVFLDGLAQKREQDLGLSEKRLEVPVSQKKIWGFLIFSFTVLSILGFKTLYLQIFFHSDYTALAQENRFLVRRLESGRGIIYDRNMAPLVSNKPSFNLIFVSSLFPEDQAGKIYSDLSSILKKPPEEIDRMVQKARETAEPVLANINHQTLIILEARLNDLPGFEIEQNSQREYIGGPAFSHVTGYTGKASQEDIKTLPDIYSYADYIGKTGLESWYEPYLRRNPGRIIIERDVHGNQLSKKVEVLPESGNSLVLWLDGELQKRLYQELNESVERVGAKSGVAVAMDPTTGGILAIVSIPSFESNLFSSGISNEDLQKLLNNSSSPLFNRAVSGTYVTGSTIKPLIAAAALQENLINPNKEIFTNGSIQVQNRYDPEIIYTYRDNKNHGWTNMRKALAESNNIYFYTIGGGYKDQRGLGPSRIKKYLELFNWGLKTGIDLPAENSGFIPSPEWKQEKRGQAWLDGDTYNISIGQGDLAITPLQVVAGFSAIANGGILYQPKLVKEIVDSEKNVREKYEPVILRQNFIDPNHLQIVREGMRWGVTGDNTPDATVTALNSMVVSAGAKTGTAQIGKNDRSNIWATVFAPYEKPEIVITILVEEVPVGQVAVLPVIKSVLDWYFTK